MKNREKVENMLRECKGCAGIKNSVGLLMNEGPYINLATLLWEEVADCMKEARERRKVLRDLNRKAYHARCSTIQQCPDSMDELSEDDEPLPKKK